MQRSRAAAEPGGGRGSRERLEVSLEGIEIGAGGRDPVAVECREERPPLDLAHLRRRTSTPRHLPSVADRRALQPSGWLGSKALEGQRFVDKETGFGILRRYWWVIVLFTVLGAAIAAVPSPQRAQDRHPAAARRPARSCPPPAATSRGAAAYRPDTNFAATGEVQRAAARSASTWRSAMYNSTLDRTGALGVAASARPRIGSWW